MTNVTSWHLAVDLERKNMRLSYKILFVTLHILAIPLHLVSVTILCTYKLTVLLLAKIFRDFAEPIKSSDSVFLADSFWKRPHSSILGGIELDRNISAEEATKLFLSVYELRDSKGRRCYRELGFCIVRYLGYGFWQPVPDFKMESRVHIWNQKGKGEEVSSPGDSGDGSNKKKSLSSSHINHEVSFISIVESLLRQGYGEPDPLWDCYIFHNFNGKPNRCLVLIRFHHIMADGMSFVKFFYSLTGSYKLPDSFTKPGTSQKKWDKIADSIWVKIWTVISVLTGGFVEYINAILVAKDRNGIQFGKNGKQKLTGNWMCSMGKQWDLGEMKKASKLHGCSVVHIILAAISGGLDRYLKKYHGDEKMPEACHFIVPLPIPGHPDLQLVNKWCISKVRAKMGLEGVSEKLAYFKEETKRCASDSIPLITAFTFQFICGILPTSVVDLGSKAKATSTLILSNVVGPQGDQRLADANIMDMFFFMPISQESTALSSGVISCNGEVRICLTADIGCVPDRARLEDMGMMMYDEMKEICESLQGLTVQMTGLQ